MISIIEKTILGHPEWLKNKDANLSFLKASTPSSGTKSVHGNIIMFAFEDDNKVPTLCIKTCRTYDSRSAIINNFKNLQQLEKDVRGTKHSGLFPIPLFLYDDNSVIFSVESVCSGKKGADRPKDIAKVIDAYTDWQKALVTKSEKKISKDGIGRIAYSNISKLGVSADSSQKLRKYFDSLLLDNDLEVPEIVQHGDLTLDNVLISQKEVHFVDFEYVGVSMIPGFDLFQFVLRTRNKVSIIEMVNQLKVFFNSIGVVVKNFDGILFAYFLQEYMRKNDSQQQNDAESLIRKFDRLLSK